MYCVSLPRPTEVKYGLGSMIAGTFIPWFVSAGRTMSIDISSVIPSPSESTPGTGMKTRSRIASG